MTRTLSPFVNTLGFVALPTLKKSRRPEGGAFFFQGGAFYRWGAPLRYGDISYIQVSVCDHSSRYSFQVLLYRFVLQNVKLLS